MINEIHSAINVLHYIGNQTWNPHRVESADRLQLMPELFPALAAGWWYMAVCRHGPASGASCSLSDRSSPFSIDTRSLVVSGRRLFIVENLLWIPEPSTGAERAK